jgi:hypothetical protein
MPARLSSVMAQRLRRPESCQNYEGGDAEDVPFGLENLRPHEQEQWAAQEAGQLAKQEARRIAKPETKVGMKVGTNPVFF